MSIVSDFLAVFDRFFSGDAQRKRQRIKLIESLLNDVKTAPSGIRSLDTLTKKTGMSAAECRDLLSEMGCVGVTLEDGREGWKKAD